MILTQELDKPENDGNVDMSLYKNIDAKQKRIKRQKAAGEKPEKMRKVGSKGAPTAKAFRQAAKTAKKRNA
tara:strand:- start:2260 stop:2472 length:213 start_codon:yes stop_codon:yes gene_type:complete